MKTNVYVDGFNLYYGCLKGTPHKWLNIRALCELLFPRNNIQKIVYCTALVSPRPSNPHQRTRQETYIRALKTLPNLEVVFGTFMPSKVTMPLVNPTPSQRFAYVHKTEEKGSDVNLATHLLIDAFRGHCEAALVLSNDSDLALPIKVVSQELQIPVGIVNPHAKPARELQKVGTFFARIRTGPLSACQFPSTMQDGEGTFTKPAGW